MVCQGFLSLIFSSSVQFSHSVLTDSLWPHEPQHTRPSCPSPTPRVYPNSCSLSWWCHPTISSSVIPFSSFPPSFPALGLFKWVSSLHQEAKALEFQLQHQSFQWTQYNFNLSKFNKIWFGTQDVIYPGECSMWILGGKKCILLLLNRKALYIDIN